MESSAPTESRPLRPWTALGLVGDLLLIGLVGVILQIFVVLIRIAMLAGTEGEGAIASLESPQQEGLMGFTATIVAAAVLVPLIRSRAARREEHPGRFLGFVPAGALALGLSALVAIGFVAALDGLTLLLGRPIVDPWTRSAYLSAGPALSVIAVIVAAPILEEVAFRGFLMGALERLGVPTFVVWLLPAALWAALHVQYDAYGIASIFAAGLVLAAVRRRSGSLVPCILIHAIVGAIALVEVAVVTARAAA